LGLQIGCAEITDEMTHTENNKNSFFILNLIKG
jgi:hypothetical protein